MLSISHLTLTARLGGQSVEVLRDVSLKLERGKVLGLVGESGAGKSMIGRVIAGHIPTGFEVTKGRIVFDDTDLLALNRKAWRRLLGRRIAFVPQEPLTALNPVLTIGQTFDEHLAHLGVPCRRETALMLQQLRSVHLPNPTELVCRYPHELSGGQCQRVLIAMAFAANPALIVADEPTTALDVVSQAHVLQLTGRAAANPSARRCCSSRTTCGWPPMCATISRYCMRANRSSTARPQKCCAARATLYLGAGPRHAGRARSAASAASAGWADARCVDTGRDQRMPVCGALPAKPGGVHGSAAGACGARQRPLGALHLSARGRGSHADGGR